MATKKTNATKTAQRTAAALTAERIAALRLIAKDIVALTGTVERRNRGTSDWGVAGSLAHAIENATEVRRTLRELAL